MKTITVVVEDGAVAMNLTAACAVIEAALKASGVVARVQDGADLAQFTDNEILQAAVDRGLVTL